MYDKLSISPKILIISDENELIKQIKSILLQEKVKYLFIDLNRIFEYEIIINDQIEIIFDSNKFLIDEKHLISIFYNIPKNRKVDSSLKLLINRLSVFKNISWLCPPSIRLSMKQIEQQLENAKKMDFNVPKVKIKSEIQLKNMNNCQIYNLEKKEYIDCNNQNPYEISNLLLIHEKIGVENYIKLFIFNNKIYSYATLENKTNKIYSNPQNSIHYKSWELPEYIKYNSMKLINNLNLKYGCVHLIENNNRYFFTQITDINNDLPLLQRFNVNFQLEFIKLLIPNYPFIKLKNIIEKYFHEIFPFIQLIISNKHIDKEYVKLENEKKELTYSSYTSQQKIYSKLYNFVEKDLKRKKSIEDKGKSSLFVFSLVTSVMTIGLSFLLKSSWGLFSTLILIIIIMYLCLAVITTLKTIGGKDYNNLDFNEIYNIEEKETEISLKESSLKRNINELYKYHELNQKIILQKINSLYTTFSLVKLTIILMVIFFVNLILTKYIIPTYLKGLYKPFLIIIRCTISFIILTLFLFLSDKIKS